jgi:hypothetical protein
MAIFYGNMEDGWSQSDESSDVEIGRITLKSSLEEYTNRAYKEKYGVDKPQEHHSW